MKKLIYFLVVIMHISFSSCKKDANIKPQTVSKETASTAKTQTAVKPTGITYDYQKAILAKRTITNH